MIRQQAGVPEEEKLRYTLFKSVVHLAPGCPSIIFFLKRKKKKKEKPLHYLIVVLTLPIAEPGVWQVGFFSVWVFMGGVLC